MNELTRISQADSRVSDQSPTGLIGSDWTGTDWNGIPIANPSGRTFEELCAFIRPKPGEPLQFLGLKQKFDQVKPFADNTAPTVAEIDNWHREVILHFRNLLGNPNPMKPDARLFLECRWSDERKHSQVWDVAYPNPDKIGKAPGPCHWPDGRRAGGAHCGEIFWPGTPERVAAIAAEPYKNDFVKYPEFVNYPGETTYATATALASQTAGIMETYAWIPWSLRLASVIAHFICTEGTTGHAGPYIGTERRRTAFGVSFWHTGGDKVLARGKFY